MCGRLNIYGDSLSKTVSSALHIHFQTPTNTDLCPSQAVSTIAFKHGMQQLNTTWGIKPTWSKKLLINAQSESVATKPTFKHAFANNRCVVPCSGWYEWSSMAGTAKHKYLFGNENGAPLYMAGIYYPRLEAPPELVTLTAEATEICAQYHRRMPFLISENAVEDWLSSPVPNLGALLVAGREPVRVVKA